MLVLAGPGSGKTTVISERVRYLIEEKGIEPGRILTITFTRAAAQEMQRRCQQICPHAGGAVFGTFHSVFYHFLRTSEKYQNFSVINEREKRGIIKKIIPIGDMTELQHSYVCESMLKKISYYKNSRNMSDFEEGEELFVRIMERYCRLCEEQEKMDFDDMLLLCHRLFEKDERVRVKWQNRFRYILVDEFQDINRCQYEIVNMLAQKHGNLFAVGDDDQAIYAFRGSDPGFMKQFLIDYPESRQVCLQENYRSGTDIVALAGKSISCNENRFAKNIRAVGTFEHQVNIVRYDSACREAEAITEQIVQMKEDGNEGSVAVLVRTNAQAEYIAEMFYQKKLPCSIHERRRCFYENPWVCDILAVLRFAVCGQKRSDFLVFMNKPFRGLERAMFKEERVEFERIIKSAGVTMAGAEQQEVVKELEKMKNFMDMIRGMDPYGAVKLILHGMKYRTYLDRISGGDESIRMQIKEVTDELMERAKHFDSILHFLEFIKVYAENFAKEESEKSSTISETEEGVQILTYHASKGLEFDSVFLPMLNDGVVPHGRMLSQEQTEEERRMFYVAMTRAKRNLRLSWHGKTDGLGASMFLKELETDKI